MSFLLDTDICSAHLKRPAGLMHRFIQHSGRLYVSTIVLGELYAWAYHRHRLRLIQRIEEDLLADVAVLDFDVACARQFGNLRGTLLQSEQSIGLVDLLIAAVAMAHQLTLVTHYTADFQRVPGLRCQDWLT
jgi:tRNA(fMet)-specific endonuclease VapC